MALMDFETIECQIENELETNAINIKVTDRIKLKLQEYESNVYPIGKL